jgi:hypothetical protein
MLATAVARATLRIGHVGWNETDSDRFRNDSRLAFCERQPGAGRRRPFKYQIVARLPVRRVLSGARR